MHLVVVVPGQVGGLGNPDLVVCRVFRGGDEDETAFGRALEGCLRRGEGNAREEQADGGTHCEGLWCVRLLVTRQFEVEIRLSF